ncbi:endonuclease III domain-containing protein [Thermofilum pendens]|uniref:HhH-GPD family protein n=1 Tax=Thermofilum pendens (strain DSM 2475 / Hrk 5) TaxID=368408 RepID=A1RWH1_THEPD|nr:base excision DNA repair protein [Thermofilum pendens]ABL77551.1 HhH-GPD family protein [Thermofilum pendens Hrk 5]
MNSCLHEPRGYELGDEILARLKGAFSLGRGEFVALDVARRGDFFGVLVATIISQNTNENNTLKAFASLEERVGVECEKIRKAGLSELAEAIRPAGLQEQKAKAIKQVASLLYEKYGCDIGKLLSRGVEEVIRELKQIEGIGDKTIDVLLANYGYPVLPIDTHVRRVSVRLGLARPGSYRAMQKSLHGFFREEARLDAHLYLIKLGRTLCRAKNPLCDECPLSDLCCYYRTSRAPHS